MVTATISSKNQIVLPKHMLVSLGIGAGDRLIVSSDDKEIRIKPVRGSVIDLVAGSIKVAENKKGLPFEKVLEETKKRATKKLVKNGK